MKSSKPVIEVNANIIDYKLVGISDFGMLRLDDCFEQYLYGPEFIDVQYTQSSDRIRLFEIIKVVFFDLCYSSCYGVFANDEHTQTDMALYQIKWNRKKEWNCLKETIRKKNNAFIPGLYPEMMVKIIILKDRNDVKRIIEEINEFDGVLEGGIKIVDSNIENNGAYNYFLRRNYWGKIELSWTSDHKNILLENQMRSFSDLLNEIADKEHTFVDKCLIGYSNYTDFI